MPAELETAALDPDFSAGAEEEAPGPDHVPIHAPKRSKSTDFPTMAIDGKTRQVIEDWWS